MDEIYRNDAPLSDPEYPQDDSGTLPGERAATDLAAYPELSDSSGAPAEGAPTGDVLHRLLPEHGTGSSNPRLNRPAKAVGRKVGTAVCRAKHWSRQVDNARSRVGTNVSRARENASAAALEWVDRAADRANQRLDEFRWKASHKSSEMSRDARDRIREVRNKARRWQRENPLESIALFGGAAFVVGLGLRIWRSNSEYDG